MNNSLRALRTTCAAFAFSICLSCGGSGEELPDNSEDGQSDTPGSNPSGQQTAENICVDTFPYRDGIGWNGQVACNLDFVVFLDPENPPEMTVLDVTLPLQSEALLDQFTTKQTKISYSSGATIALQNEANENGTRKLDYVDPQGSIASGRLDSGGRLHNVEFSDGTVVEYLWANVTLKSVILTDASGGVYYFAFAAGRFYQTESLEYEEEGEPPSSTTLNFRRIKPSESTACRYREIMCITTGVLASLSFPACVSGSRTCTVLGAGLWLSGSYCAFSSLLKFCQDDEPAEGSWCTVTRGDEKSCVSNPLSACQIQHANFGEPSPFLGMSEGSSWWNKECQWDTCGGLARPDCTLFAPTSVVFSCEDRVNFEREFPGTCVPRN